MTPVAPVILPVNQIPAGIAQMMVVEEGFEPFEVTGSLEAGDRTLDDDSYYDAYTFSGEAGVSLIIEMQSTEFDTYLILMDRDSNPVAFNDDSEGTNSRIVVTLPTTGIYAVLANSYGSGEIGSYRLTIREENATTALPSGSRTTVELEETEGLPQADALMQQIDQLESQGRYREAIPLAQQAIAIREEALGAEALPVADSLNQLGLLHRAQGNYSAAEPLYQRALAIREAGLGSDHPDVAESLNNLAVLYYTQGNYTAAIPLLERSLSILESVLGEDHEAVGIALNNLAQLYEFQGDYFRAEQAFQRSLPILEQTLGADHPNVASSLNNLAALYRLQGNYAAAEPLYQQSLAIRLRVLGENHPDVADSYNNLASMYIDQGNYDQAESLYQRAIAIEEATVGPTHPDVAQTLNNLAELYRIQGDYSAAEPLYRQSLEIREAALGEAHPVIAYTLNNLATLYHAQGDDAAAIPLYERARQIFEGAIGRNHPFMATTLNNLGAMYAEQGEIATAEALYQAAIDILEATVGETHPRLADSLINLGSSAWVRGDRTEALASLGRAAEIQEQNLGLTLALGSEARRRAYISTLTFHTNMTVSLHLQEAVDQPEAAELALTTVLRRKGRVLDATTDSFRTLRQQVTPENQALLDELRVLETQRATLEFSSTVGQAGDRLSTLETRAEELRNLLAQRSAEFRRETQPITIAGVQQQIPTDAALVELVRYDTYNPRQEGFGSPRYAAYVLFRDGAPRWVDLGDAETLDAQVFAFRDALSNPDSNIQTIARELDVQLMQPIRELVGDTPHLLISPDGTLNLIPFAALMDEGNAYLAERYTFTYLTSGRDLVRMQRDGGAGQRSVLIANPDYDAGEIPPSPPYQGGNQAQSPPYEGGFRGIFQAATGEIPPSPPYQGGDRTQSSPYQGELREISGQRSSDFGNLEAFAPLPGTQEELEAIAPLLPNPLLLQGATATEAALKQVENPNILHIATHGFFLQDQDCLAVPNARSGGREAYVTIESATETDCIPTPRNVEDPLLRSGLVFAGVNQRTPSQEVDDGVLTAQEVARMNLDGTQLVVLSACETGLGNVVNGEGVYGLRRAFVLAGAESQLMSLWQVDDFGTSTLMQGYYERITAGTGRSEALREVQQELLNTGAYEHPYYWAGFIFSGDWRSLESL
ncbi:MAG: tetratricopeptide repeat protein [Cyanobacteria bacterium J06638_22]